MEYHIFVLALLIQANASEKPINSNFLSNLFQSHESQISSLAVIGQDAFSDDLFLEGLNFGISILNGNTEQVK